MACAADGHAIVELPLRVERIQDHMTEQMVAVFVAQTKHETVEVIQFVLVKRIQKTELLIIRWISQ